MRPTRPGLIVWFTGVSGAGKSTLARKLEVALAPARPVGVLDGDEVREYLSKGLGYTREDRDTNVRRIGYVARAVARTGAVAICAAISPYAETRGEVRALAAKDKLAFLEVYLHAPMSVLTARDTKGLYAKALAGQLQHFTGVNDPYEVPPRPEVNLDTSNASADACVRTILAAIEAQGPA